MIFYHVVTKTTNLDLLICSAYFPPRTNRFLFDYDLMSKLLFLDGKEDVLLLGDFKAKMRDWGCNKDDQMSGLRAQHGDRGCMCEHTRVGKIALMTAWTVGESEKPLFVRHITVDGQNYISVSRNGQQYCISRVTPHKTARCIYVSCFSPHNGKPCNHQQQQYCISHITPHKTVCCTVRDCTKSQTCYHEQRRPTKPCSWQLYKTTIGKIEPLVAPTPAK
ncbi:PREDICTED: uncharacterized protein LOC108368186 [Rhagoletis zephyria]|uniref:uncharacterized protein LOC108368186 n=1 Tax=Rhagoletis zephyria TaxID=28612 RepID=UPI0008119F96|nr:PREDICTED: uncharacterized protein LOC108368186 [Rhagoletis zephyria]